MKCKHNKLNMVKKQLNFSTDFFIYLQQQNGAQFANRNVLLIDKVTQ